MFELPWFWIWVVLAAALYVGEMLTTTFFLLPFAVGATASALAALFGGPLWLQWLLFVVISVVVLIALRPLARRLQKDRPERSGVDRLIGMTGEIIEGNAPSGEQRARIAREIWNVTIEGGGVGGVGGGVGVGLGAGGVVGAGGVGSSVVGAGGEGLPVGTQVRVTGVDGVHLLVVPA